MHPFTKWTLRTEANASAQFKFVVTEFGKEATGKQIEFKKCLGVFSNGKDAPILGQPPLNVPNPITTDENGMAIVNIPTLDPNKPRGYIDGQLYGFCYSVTGSRPPNPSSLDNVIVIMLYNGYKDEPSPTWLDNILPIFKQYADLYPVMTENFVDLGNYYEVTERRFPILESLALPMSHPNHMPVTRDLSDAKRKVILKWLRTDGLPIGDRLNKYSLEHLKKDLQTALQIEHATIPTYLTAFSTIKDIYNLEVQSMFKTILVQEMLHMALVANILNAVGGDPKLYFDGFIPEYPSHLPGGVQPDLAVPIGKCSLALIRNVFMKIEEPYYTKTSVKVMDTHSDDVNTRFAVPKFGQLVQGAESCPSSHYSCHAFESIHGLGRPKKSRFSIQRSQGKPDGKDKFRVILPSSTYPNITIGGFYKNIEEGLKHLSEKNNIFTGMNTNDLRGYYNYGGQLFSILINLASDKINGKLD